MENLATYAIAIGVTLFFFFLYWRKQKRLEARAQEAAQTRAALEARVQALEAQLRRQQGAQ